MCHLQHCCNPKCVEGTQEVHVRVVVVVVGGILNFLDYLKPTDCAQGESKQCFGCSQQSGVRQEASIYPHQYPCLVTLALAQQHSSKVCVKGEWGGGSQAAESLSIFSIHPSSAPINRIGAGEGEYPCCRRSFCNPIQVGWKRLR